VMKMVPLLAVLPSEATAALALFSMLTAPPLSWSAVMRTAGLPPAGDTVTFVLLPLLSITSRIRPEASTTWTGVLSTVAGTAEPAL